jgi:hypothetical protein
MFPALIDVPACMVQAAEDYAIPLRGLIAVWLVEGGQLGTISKNKNGTNDYGPMQINDVWAKRLQEKFSVTPQMITHDFCWSVRAGAYILRDEINRAGGSFWDGVGHYHSRTPQHKQSYIQRVYSNSLKF